MNNDFKIRLKLSLRYTFYYDKSNEFFLCKRGLEKFFPKMGNNISLTVSNKPMAGAIKLHAVVDDFFDEIEISPISSIYGYDSETVNNMEFLSDLGLPEEYNGDIYVRVRNLKS